MGTTSNANGQKPKNMAIRSTLIGILLVGLTVGGYNAYSAVQNQRISEAMEAEAIRQSIEAEEQAAERATAPIEIDGAIDLDASQQESISFLDDVISWQGKRYKRETYKKAILCLGIDRSDDMTGTRELGSAGQADAIFLVCQDTARNEVKIVMIPRDTITEITLSDGQGNTWQDQEHLSVAFGYGDGSYGSCESECTAVSKLLFDLPMDDYFAVDMAVLTELNDAVGGVTVTIQTDGMEERDPAFVKGAVVHLQGEQAEKFLRFRDISLENSAVQRMSQHKEYMTAYFAALKAKQRENSNIVQEIFAGIQNNMLTNMAKDQYLKLALDTLNGSGLSGDSILYLPGSARNSWTWDEYYMNQSEAIPLLLELFCREVG